VANPLGYPNLLETIARMERRIRELERIRYPLPPQNLDDLDDGQVSYGAATAPAAGDVLTWTSGATPFGGLWMAAPATAGDLGVLETVAEYTDDGIFDEVSPFDTSFSVTVSANSRQLVIISAFAEPSESTHETTVGVTGGGGGTVDVSFNHPTPWKMTARDQTYDPTGDDEVGQGSVGPSGAQVALWLTNDTDEDRSNTLVVAVEGLTSAYEFDATVTVTARSVFSLIAP